MSRTHKVHAWSIAAVCALIFVFSASAEQALRAVARAVTPEAVAIAQDPTTPPQETPAPAAGRGAGRGATAPRPYTEIVTGTTKTSNGIFKVHRNGDTVFYEIPKNELDKDYLWTVRIKKTTLGTGFGGKEAQSRVVRWHQRGDRVLLEDINFSTYADPSLPVAQAVADANYPAIIKTLPVAAYAPNGDPVVDVTQFFTTDGTPEFSARAAITGAGQLDGNRTFLESVKAFPQNINAEITMTFTGGGGAAAGGGGGRGGGGGGGGMRGSSGTVVVAHSMVKLPEKPLMQRAYDDRVGFSNEAVTDFGTDEHRSVTKRYIYRFRMEKKDPSAAVSDPVTPIVFYIDPATPAKFVPYVKRGVESWQAAFEAAGFRNAIQAKEAPKDADFSMEDARYSVVRWSPSNGEEMTTLRDPRSGEIISADVRAFPNVQTFGSSWYLAQAGPLDKRAAQLPLPDDLVGELIRSLVAHQVGHSLGLVHNLKASSLYTIAQVRNAQWVKENGYSPSILDDAGFNYVAQPEDNIDPNDLIPKVGPYDKFAIAWGYRPVPGAKTPDAEKPTLDQWAREQDSKPYLRFTTETNNNSSDPGESPETPDTAAVQLPGPVGDTDAVTAASLGLKNLSKVSTMLMKATTTKVGDPWDDLEEVYGRMASLWSVEMAPVVRVIGGEDSRQLHIGQEGMRFKTVPKQQQTLALEFLLNNAFKTPDFMIRPDVLRRIQASGAVDRVRTAQTAILTSLLQNQRIDRMTEQATLDPTIAYSPLQFLTDVRNGIWSELAKGAPIDLYRRNLQRAYLWNLDLKLNGTPEASAEIRSLVKGELRALDRQLQTASAAATLDEATKRHISDCREEIKIILDPRVPRPSSDPTAAPAAGGRGRGGLR